MGAVAGAPEGHPADAAEQTPETPGFGERGRMRRRARFLRKARELAYRDLGGLVFDLHRFGERNDPVVMAKLATLRQIDTELRALEGALNARRPVTVLREVGIGACPRCAAIHGSDDRFCPGCGLAFDTNADRPIATAPVARAPVMPQPMPTPAPQPVPAQTPLSTPITTQQPASGPVTTQPAPGPAPGQTAPPPGTGSNGPQRPRATPPPQPTSAPFPAKSAAPEPTKQTDEDEPTQILRPPATGA
jgi:hypothetical protein